MSDEKRIVPDENGQCPVGYHKMPPDENHDTEWCMEGESHPENEGEYSRAVDTVPTDQMAARAAKGLKWREEYGRGGTEVGVARARDIKNKAELSESTIKRMVSFFARHRVDLDAPAANPNNDGYPSAGVIAWLLWGGDPNNPDGAGHAWAKRKAEQFDNEKEENSMTVEEKEIRVCQDAALAEVRYMDDDEDKKPKIVGYASVFNSLSENLGGFREIIQQGAFAQSLMDNDEVHALFNHDDSRILGRRGAGTLNLVEDDYGLRVEIDPPNTTDGNDVVELLKRGDLVSMSFGFYNVEDTWETRDGMDVRIIKQARLFDVSVVANPAYPATQVNVRSHKNYLAQKEIEKTDFDSVGEAVRLNLKLRLAELDQ